MIPTVSCYPAWLRTGSGSSFESGGAGDGSEAAGALEADQPSGQDDDHGPLRHRGGAPDDIVTVVSPPATTSWQSASAVHLAEYLVIGLAGAATGLATGWFAAPVLIRPSAGLIGSANAQPPTLRMAIAVTALALTIAVAATLVPVVRAAATSTVHALADAATPPRRRRGRIWLSRRLPTALLIGVRINARRPRRARLVTVNTLITTTALVAMLIVNTRLASMVATTRSNWARTASASGWSKIVPVQTIHVSEAKASITPSAV
ncbi:hypothetical protein [Micromonospora sp. NPDC048063]|uniref:hypothetical protein n=1 Tax=Micromonospora sp. NPDC048063 TaxID=3364256 RepID=UPI003713B866